MIERVHMLKRILGYKWYILVIMALIIVEPTVTSWLVLWLQSIYNKVIVGMSHIEIIRLILIGVLVWMCKRILVFSISVIKARFICDMKQDLKHDVFTSTMGLKTANIFQIGASGEYISAFTNDIAIIEQRYFSNIISVISQIISIGILGTTFFSMNHKLAFLMFSFGIIAMLIPPIFAQRLNNANLKYSKKLSKFTQKLKEYLHAYSTIKNYSIEKTIMERFDICNAEVEKMKFEYDCELSLADSIGSLLTWFTRIIVIGAGLIMVANGEIMIGTVVAAQAFSEELATPLQDIIANINSIKSVKSIIQKMNHLTKEDSILNEKKDKVEILGHNDELNIEFCNLTIPIKDRNIVDNFSFEFKQGGKYLIIGKNGSGKSSIFKALKKGFRQYDGRIMINNVELKEIPNSELSKLISYLNENVAIFSDSIEDNITFGRNVSEEILNDAIKNARIEIDLQRSVGEDGFDLSSGEQRKIEIARSLISPAKIMIFDEVVSTLDIETAYDIEQMVLNYDNKTVIFISHNFSGKLIRKYDEILVMKDGCLVAHGNYDTLMRESEYFKRISKIKFG